MEFFDAPLSKISNAFIIEVVFGAQKNARAGIFGTCGATVGGIRVRGGRFKPGRKCGA
jgi:hypothetical protein